MTLGTLSISLLWLHTNNRARFGGLDSLMRLLMGVDALQTLVIDVLLEWMAEYMSSEGEEME